MFWILDLVVTVTFAVPAEGQSSFRASTDDDVARLALEPDRVRTLVLDGPGVTDAAGDSLTRFHRVHELIVAETAMWGPGLECLGSMPRLERLVLFGDSITDEALVHVGAATGLRKLEVTSGNVTGVGMRHWAGLTRLEWLMLFTPCLRPDSLDGLRPLVALRDLTIQADVADVDLAPLAALTDLRTLGVPEMRVTGPGLVALAGLPRLHGVNVGVHFGRDHLACVDPLRHLRGVDLARTGMSFDEVLRYLEAHPEVQRVRVPPAVDLRHVQDRFPQIQRLGGGCGNFDDPYRSPDRAAERQDATTDLMDATLRREAERVGSLIETGVDVDAPAPCWSVRGFHDLMPPEQRPWVSASPLFAACLIDQPEIAERLIAAGADVDDRSSEGSPCVVAAAATGSARIVTALIDARVDLAATDAVGRTALMHAGRFGHEDVVGRLLDAGADRQAVDQEGRTAADHAASGRYRALAERLR